MIVFFENKQGNIIAVESQERIQREAIKKLTW